MKKSNDPLIWLVLINTMLIVSGGYLLLTLIFAK